MGAGRSQYRYFYIGLAGVTALSFGLRFWGLGRFDALIFDEVYYAKFAQGYLRGVALFDAHPPLGKYAIALGIWLHDIWLHSHFSNLLFSLSFGPFANELTIHPVSYRWVNALVGALTPLLVMAIGWRLSKNFIKERWTPRISWFVLLSGVFVAIDGLFVTESRYALINIYVVFFGLLSHGLWLWASELTGAAQRKQSIFFRLLSGMALGAAIATKWNGLGYGLSLLLWEICRRFEVIDVRRLEVIDVRIKHPVLRGQRGNFLVSLVYLAKFLAKFVLFYGFFLGLVPAVVYCLIWWPHLSWAGGSLVSLHHTLLTFHQGLETFQVTCSRWFSWPLLIKPMAYGYVDAGTQVFTVNNMGNPALWWLSGAAAGLIGIERALAAQRGLIKKVRGKKAEIEKANIEKTEYLPSDAGSLKTYLLIGYLANWLPWMMVGRCTYIYLFMPAAVYGFMLLAWLVSGWLMPQTKSQRESENASKRVAESRWLGLAMLGAIALSFFFWLPLSLGLALTPEQLQLRWWLPSWI